MFQFTTVSEIKNYINLINKTNDLIGFIPTMGALHEGHLSLVKKSLGDNNITVVSIFVNPIQFNNKIDLKNYPRSLESDIEKLKKIGCDIVFVPTYNEMYPDENFETIEFGDIENVMEGALRPGHFNGVAIVVKRLFDIISPHRAYFGEKDYQQLLIIKELVMRYDIPVEIVPVQTIREKSGLAMSSRNELLSIEGRNEAKFLYDLLVQAKNMSKDFSFNYIKQFIYQQFNKNKNFKLDYFEIVDEVTLQPVLNKNKNVRVRAFIAAFIENIRLIDNISFD